ncbi:hypothetical protein DM860_014880 [Cuscuta australis]|uniref:BAH domain-containing protein n=1 Tax=Cuscuta australis TaxID=267555 RepID=A0A328DMQ6_9ASTE|nr:hypothetical protein DM860_014880 [Cuscuta australis]
MAKSMTSSARAVLEDFSTSAGKLDKSEGLEFVWGKKRGVGGKKREVQFYDSFKYDGVQYALHDCVYMHKEGEPEPYIGKLIKIWETADKSKKIKVQWFFRPSEILYHIKDQHFMGNEIFLASGEGIGLSNVNPLEAIAGKCNVVCISEDTRNCQPSEEELKEADYVFYRVFDVARFTLDDIGDTVGGLEVRFVFNRNESEKASQIVKLSSEQNKDTHARVQFNMQKTGNGLKIEMGDPNSRCVALKKNELDLMHGDGNVILKELDSTTEIKPTAVEQIDSIAVNEVILEEDISADKTACNEHKNMDGDTSTKPHMIVVGVDESTNNMKCFGASDSWASSRVKHASVMPLEYKDSSCNKRSSLNDTKPQVRGVTTSPLKEKTDKEKDHCELVKDVKSIKDSIPDLERPWKKAKIDFSAISEDKNKSNVHKPDARSGENEDKVIPKAVDSCQEKISKPSKICAGLDNNSNKEILSPNGSKCLVKPAPPTEVNTKNRNDEVPHSCGLGNDDKPGKYSNVGEDRTSKKAKIDVFDKKSIDGKFNSQRPSIKHIEDEGNVLLKGTNSFKERAILPKPIHGFDEGLTKARSSMKPNKLSINNISSLGGTSTNVMEELHDKAVEVTPRHVESITWFKELSWEERMQTANDQGTLVLLRNLDPVYISVEVEDIIWYAFKEKCSAKMIQHSAFSNPNIGQALAIFKTRDAAEKVIRMLKNRYLLVSEQRPLVADIIALPKSQRSSSFVGHLVIDKVRHQMQREMKEAVSTSHCSQPNTIEYEMAMEWRLRQSRSEFCLKTLHKQQGDELRRAAAKLKT